MAVSGLLGLTACATPPAVPRPLEAQPPAAWRQAESTGLQAPASVPGLSDASWWEALADPQLSALQQQASKTHVESLRKDLARQVAQLRARHAGLDEQPRVDLSLSRNESRPLTGSGRTRQSSYGVNLALGYELDAWSRLAHTTSAAQAEVQASLEDLRDVRALLGVQVAEAYWRIATLDAQQPLLAEQQALADEAVRIAQRRWAEGQLPRLEVDVAISQQFQVRKRLHAVTADRALQLQALGRLLDGPVPGLTVGQAQLPAAEPGGMDLSTPAQALERRPDVRRARRMVDAELARAGAAEAARYPALRLNTGLSAGGSGWRDWISQPLATLGLSLAVPLVDWRRMDVQRDIARLQLDDAALALRATVRQALVDVESALVEDQRWRADWAAAQNQQAEKARAERVAQLRLSAGAAARLDLLQARQARLDAESTLVDLRLRGWLNRLQLFKATGVAVPTGGVS
jgi:outer membrane protein TolC